MTKDTPPTPNSLRDTNVQRNCKAMGRNIEVVSNVFINIYKVLGRFLGTQKKHVKCYSFCCYCLAETQNKH